MSIEGLENTASRAVSSVPAPREPAVGACGAGDTDTENAVVGAHTVAGVALVVDPAGALYWPEEGLLAVSDLHLEKGSSYARRGIFLPPYDTPATLARLARLVARYAPRVVAALGDNFHDGGGPDRLALSDRSALADLQRAREWIWITGNHDPEPMAGIGGIFSALFAIGSLVFRHHPTAEADGEIAGHLHPVARVSVRSREIGRRCFAADDKRMVMPAFGAYAGGLNVRDTAFAEVFPALAFTAHLLGEQRLYTIAGARCLSDHATFVARMKNRVMRPI